MHAKIPIRFSILLTLIFLAIVLIAAPGPSVAQSGANENESPPPIPSSGNPEYKIKTLPNDTFKPSEKISEDFPVPFPVDI